MKIDHSYINESQEAPTRKKKSNNTVETVEEVVAETPAVEEVAEEAPVETVEEVVAEAPVETVEEVVAEAEAPTETPAEDAEAPAEEA